jgi:hypothetical protein
MAQQHTLRLVYISIHNILTRALWLCRVDNHTLLANETIYTRVYFPLPQDKDYYIVGFLADIVNKVHVHHFIVRFCTEGLENL